ncbi:MFS transporter (plasmid) [Mycolicibacterium frederiksbergense]|uniref:MFS transporter n=1 Tax=Mycolicibacterium frederiksbergense TaxID=117567 RepID=A0A6H0S0M2_9MYCO|nr:MFS transporter [Mycolicibacterium frederiksbergense]
MRGDTGLRSERGPILRALMLSTALVALDSTILATAILTLAEDLGGFSQFPWLFSIYLLAQGVCTPIYGKLADTFGRKPVMLWGIGVFALGSVLCGMATSMFALVAFRAVQGVGAGAVQPMTMTIAGDIYTLEERAKVQGYIASMWAMSAVVGPTLGGLFSDYLHWRWIFFINVPLCLFAGWSLIRNFHEERATDTARRIDYLGGNAHPGGSPR